MGQTPLESQPKESSILHSCWDERHCMEFIDGSTLDFTGNEDNVPTLLGLMLTSANALVLAANVANVAKVVLTDDPLVLNADGTIKSPDPTKLKVIDKGPAMLKKGGLRTTDHVGDAYNMTTLEATLKDLGITLIDEPQVTATQSAV